MSSIGTTWACPPPVPPPFEPNTGPTEGSRRHSIALAPTRWSPWTSPIEVVVLPSPSEVGVMPVTTTLPFVLRDLDACLSPPGRTLPGAAYTSEDVLAWERERFFEGSWTCAGRAEDLAGPGDQRAIRVGTEAILLVRGKDGACRGFSNTWRHRGHELLPCGGPVVTSRAIRCPYHSWTYGLDGRFKTAPSFVDRADWRRDDPDNSLL